jgi:hypothetical protein
MTKNVEVFYSNCELELFMVSKILSILIEVGFFQEQETGKNFWIRIPHAA